MTKPAPRRPALLARRAFLATAAAPLAASGQADLSRVIVDVLRRHLESLLEGGDVVKLNGKDAEGSTAMTFHRMARITGEAKYSKAAAQLAERVVRGMHSSPSGLLDTKLWRDTKIMYGGPPPLGWYAAYAGAILGGLGRMDDVRFIAGVLDRYPWYEGGWWSSEADVRTGRTLEPLGTPTPINKSCAMVLACAVLSELVAPADPAVAARLRERTLKCVRAKIIPAQRADGYWNYKFAGPDGPTKDTVGYLMLGTGFLIRARQMAPSFREPALDRAIARAEAFAMREIAPMTAPNAGKKPANLTNGATPERYDPAAIPKRSFQLAVLLADGGYKDEAVKILSHAMPRFPMGDRGQTGSLCAEAASLVAAMWGARPGQ